VTFAVVFGAFGVAQIVLAFSLGAAGAPLAWSGLAWVLVAAAYAGLGARIFGKRPDGGRSAAAHALLFPYLAFTWLAWRAGIRRGTRVGQEVAPGIWLGPRPIGGRLPEGVAAVLDMTSEFGRTTSDPAVEYVCIPVLDGTPPDQAALCRAVEWIAGRPGPVYVHCAAGNQRSATVVIAALLARRHAADVAAALAHVRARRPSVRPTSGQLRCLDAYAASLGPRDAAGPDPTSSSGADSDAR
jgi:protein-tyrosine phosphatase